MFLVPFVGVVLRYGLIPLQDKDCKAMSDGLRKEFVPVGLVRAGQIQSNRRPTVAFRIFSFGRAGL